MSTLHYTIILLPLLYFCSVATHQCSLDTEGYYWRDFAGDIPRDALPGGKDVNGKPIYIGQVLYDTKLIPAKIYEGDKNAYFEWGGEHTAVKFVKILCTRDGQKFEWISRNTDDMHLLTNRHLIDGGYEPDSSTYVGRIYIDGETTIGKVIVYESTKKASFLGVKDGKRLLYETFEVLVYNPDINDISALIDARFSSQ